jgi:hypothetical protein
MAGKTKSGTWRISYTLKGQGRREISLSGRYEKIIGITLVKLLADTVSFGTHLSTSDALRVEKLPPELRNKLIEYQLIEAKVAEKIPTISQLIKQFMATRSDVKDSTLVVDKRRYNYLREYFENNTRIDSITYASASKIRIFYQSPGKFYSR